MTATFLLLIVSAYLLGSLSAAIIISLCLNLPNPTQLGSKNPGATNMYRLTGKGPAIATLVFDVAKGVLPVWVALYLGAPDYVVGLVALAVCLGHIFPLFFGFNGGKAVATGCGVMLALDPAIALLCVTVWIACFYWLRISSIAAVVAVSLAPLLSIWLEPQRLLPTSMLAAIIILRHHRNIIRLLGGNEAKL